VFARYEQSGLNQQVFCEHEGIPFFSFKNQRSKYLKRQAKSSDFASVKVRAQASYDVELQLPQGTCLKFNVKTPVDYVKRLLSVLR
jgi:hypothetical protein